MAYGRRQKGSPYRNAADIAIAMGHSGTDVAREMADVVLEDDNLETLIIAVANGRNTYKNIRKSVHFFKDNLCRYSKAYDLPGCHRTSNMVDRLMQRMDRHLFSTK